jgi:hypothetical protein
LLCFAIALGSIARMYVMFAMDRDATLDLYVSELSSGRELRARWQEARDNSTCSRKADGVVIRSRVRGLLSVAECECGALRQDAAAVMKWRDRDANTSKAGPLSAVCRHRGPAKLRAPTSTKQVAGAEFSR